MDEDYYQALGLSRGASDDEIQKAYRTLAGKFHPDLNPDDRTAKEKFQAVQRAYEVLSDPKSKEMYDRYGRTFDSSGPNGPGGGTWRHASSGPGGTVNFDFGQFFGEGAPGGGVDDILRHFTQGNRTRAASARPATSAGAKDLQYRITVPFNTAVTGGEHRLHLKRPDGSSETVTVKIPAGIDDGKKIRLRGQGAKPKWRGQPGDLIITVQVSPHPYFRRRGSELYLDVPITVAEAAFGAKVDIPTPDGIITLTVPPGTSSGQRLRVRQRGVPSPSGKRGDMYAEMQIVLPKPLDEDALELFRKLGSKYQEHPRGDLCW